MSITPHAPSGSDPIFIGIDLGGTSIHAAAVQNGRILAECGAKTPKRADPDEVMARMARLVGELGESVGATELVAGVCVGAPGTVDSDAGVVRNAPNLGWADVPAAEALSEIVGLPVVLENDVTIGAIGEYEHGAGTQSPHMAAIFVGTGVGGALIVNGEPLHGARGAAGEFGHLVSTPGGRRCGCGKAGCFEAYASRTAMETILRERVAAGGTSAVLDLMAERRKKRMSSSIIERALDMGDPLLTEVVAQAQQHLAMLVANLVNAVDPEVIVFGGGLVARLGTRFVDPIAREARKGFLQQSDADRVRIVPGTLGDHAGTLGAAVVARRRIGVRASALAR